MLEIRLTDRDWLAGPGRGKFSIADMNVLPWVNIHAYSGVETLDEWPHLKVRWPEYSIGTHADSWLFRSLGWSALRHNLGLMRVSNSETRIKERRMN